MNKIWIYGTIGQDPVCSMTKDGLEVAKMSIASNSEYNKEHTDWLNLVCFGTKVTNYIKPYVKKGTRVNVWGRIHTSLMEQDGKKFKSYQIYVEDINITNSPEQSKAEKPEVAAQTQQPSDNGESLFETSSVAQKKVETPFVEPQPKPADKNDDPLFSGVGNDENWFE